MSSEWYSERVMFSASLSKSTDVLLEKVLDDLDTGGIGEDQTRTILGWVFYGSLSSYGDIYCHLAHKGAVLVFIITESDDQEPYVFGVDNNAVELFLADFNIEAKIEHNTRLYMYA